MCLRLCLRLIALFAASFQQKVVSLETLQVNVNYVLKENQVEKKDQTDIQPTYESFKHKAS